MGAGPLLDVSIALHVFGWRCLDSGADPYREPYLFWCKGEIEEPHPWSTSWDAMREVVEAMQERDYWLCLRMRPGGCDATFDKRFPPTQEIPCESWQRGEWVTEMTLPHAVCEAARKAMSDD